MNKKYTHILQYTAIASFLGLCLFALSGCGERESEAEKHERELRQQAKVMALQLEGMTGEKHSEEEQYQFLKKAEKYGLR